MKSKDLSDALVPFAMMTNRHALSVNYKVLQISANMVRACSAYGILEADLELGADQPFVIDTTSFIAVVKSLPPDEEVSLKIEGDTLRWECGLASGKLALIKSEVTIPAMPGTTTMPWDIKEDFLTALQLGSLSCGDASLATVGVFGILLDNRRDFTILSTDDITIASCSVGERVVQFPAQTVISPDACKLLVAVAQRAEKPHVAINEQAIYTVAQPYRLLLRPIPPLKQDIATLSDAFASKEVVASIPHERVAAFVKRATALAESARHTYVDISAAEGALSLAFAEDRAASEEYYIAEGLEVPSLPPIRVDAGRLARALSHTSGIVLDHIERGVLVLIGEKPKFFYMLAGRKESRK